MRKIFNLNYVDVKKNLFEKRNKNIKDSKRNIDLVLFGDSITEGFDINRYYPTNKTYINSGIGGDQIHIMVERFEEDCLQFNPKRVIFMGGINDLRAWIKEGEISEVKIVNFIVSNVKSIVKQAKNAQVKLIVCGIIKNNEFDLRPVYLNSVIDKINEQIEEICLTEDVDYIDYNQVLVDDTDLLNLNLCPDGLHPDHNGYIRMVELIKKYL